MQTKISVVGIKARDKVIKGADYVADMVKSTLGPFGLNALLEKGNHPTNDGYTISAELSGTLDDEFERRGALALHEASSKTNDEVGDATSTSEALTQAIVREAIKYLPSEKSITAKKKPSEILKMIEDNKKEVIATLKTMATDVASEQELINSAKVSVEDEELAKLIGEAQWKIGKDGFILAEEVNEPKSSIQVVKGIRIDNGFGTPYVVTDEKNQTLDIRDVNIILTNYTIKDAADLQLLNKNVFSELIKQKKNNVVIIARAFSSEVIRLCLESSQKGFAIFPINAPYTYQGEIMRDLAAITGATYYDMEEKALEDMRVEDVGFATKLLARRFDAIITGINDETKVLANEAVQKRVKQLQDRLDGGQLSDFEKKALQARLAQFNGGFAILKVGAETPFERKYKYDKAQDAVNSVRLALQGGTVKGGGLAFKEISESLPDGDILKKPLLCINQQIMESAPQDFVIEDWVRDPYLTLVSALKNACSVAGQLISINAVITTKDIKPKADENESAT